MKNSVTIGSLVIALISGWTSYQETQRAKFESIAKQEMIVSYVDLMKEFSNVQNTRSRRSTPCPD